MINNSDLPFCPICQSRLTPSRIECSDLSGWMIGYGCSCTEALRSQHDLSEVIVWTDKDISDGLETLMNTKGDNL